MSKKGTCGDVSAVSNKPENKCIRLLIPIDSNANDMYYGN